MKKISSIEELKSLVDFNPTGRLPLDASLAVTHESTVGNQFNVGFAFNDWRGGTCQIWLEYINRNGSVEVTSSFSRDWQIFEHKRIFEKGGQVSLTHFWVSNREFKDVDPEGYVRQIEKTIEGQKISLIEVWRYHQDDFPFIAFLDVHGLAYLPLQSPEDIYTIIHELNESSSELDLDEDDWVEAE